MHLKHFWTAQVLSPRKLEIRQNVLLFLEAYENWQKTFAITKV